MDGNTLANGSSFYANNLEEKAVITDNGVEHKYGFAKYLHDSLPNATYVGFTGTPIDEMDRSLHIVIAVFQSRIILPH